MRYSNEEERRAFVREHCLNWAARIDRLHASPTSGTIPSSGASSATRTSWPTPPAEVGGPRELAGYSRRARSECENIVKSHSFDVVSRRSEGARARSAARRRPGAWREGLSPEDQKVAQEIMGRDLARQLGYET